MPIAAPSGNMPRDVSFTSIAEQYVQAIRAGKKLSMDDFISRYPWFEKEIRLEFPTILLAEQLHRPKKASESQPESLPSMIGNYRITSEIGRGGMGRVFAGYHRTMKRAVAIKVLAIAGDTSRTDAIRRFDREARAAGQLNHPNIVQIYDYGTQDDYLYIVMHRVRGLDLAKIIAGLSDEKQRSGNKNLAMDWRMIAQIGTQVASAIGHAHEKGMIHRDIKPANLMMETNGHTWVTDFGLVKVAQVDQSLSRTGDLIGTPRYMAPEQLRGISDARSDIYGLGITLYELATGQRAWDELSGQQILSQRSTLELPAISSLNPTVPAALCDIIMKCCAFKPDDRYQSAAELHYVLNRYCHGQRIGDRRRTRNSERSILNRRPIRIARIAATLAGVGLFGWWLYEATRKPSPYKDPVAALRLLKDDSIRSEFIKELPGIIEEVINNNDPKFRNVVGDLAEEAMNKTVQNLEIPDERKQEVMANVDTAIKEYKSGKLPVIRADEFQRLHSEVAGINPFFLALLRTQQSNLSAQEKLLAQQWFALLQKGIWEKRFAPEVIERMRLSQVDYLCKEGSTDDDLRAFLDVIVKETTAIGGRLNSTVAAGEPNPLGNQIDAAMKDPAIGRLIHELQLRAQQQVPVN